MAGKKLEAVRVRAEERLGAGGGGARRVVRRRCWRAKAAGTRVVWVRCWPCFVDRCEGVSANWGHQVCRKRAGRSCICVEAREGIRGLETHCEGNVRLQLRGERVNNRRGREACRWPHGCWLDGVGGKGGVHWNLRARVEAGRARYPHGDQDPFHLLLGHGEVGVKVGGIGRRHGVEMWVRLVDLGSRCSCGRWGLPFGFKAVSCSYGCWLSSKTFSEVGADGSKGSV